MSDTSSNEELISRHRQEKKELLALTQKMKSSVPKGDKKKKKDVMAEIATMISNLEIKHEEENQKFKEQSAMIESNEGNIEMNSDSAQTTKCSELDIGKIEDSELMDVNATQKLSKAQKRRNKKAEKDKARAIAISEQELENMKGSRFLEAQEITIKLSEKELVLHEIPSDGNCLFKAIEHQLSLHNLKKMSAEELREQTSNYLIAHKEDYQPFLINPLTDDMYTDDQYLAYCQNIKDPSVWGGHVEVQALAHICGTPIEIIQANGPDIISGEDYDNLKLTISYHRHQFGLGAHYNSTKPL